MTWVKDQLFRGQVAVVGLITFQIKVCVSVLLFAWRVSYMPEVPIHWCSVEEL